MVLVVLLAFAVGFELATGGAAGAIGVAGPRAVYRKAWWLAPCLVAGAGGYLVVADDASRWVRLVGASAAILVVASAVRFPYRQHGQDDVGKPGSRARRSLGGDRNRAKRVIAVWVAAAVLAVVGWPSIPAG